MSDEFYDCSVCGVQEGGSKIKYKVGSGLVLTPDEYNEIVDVLGRDFDYEETQVCSVCDNETEMVCFARTE